jgi:hypothetical protein
MEAFDPEQERALPELADEMGAPAEADALVG